MSIPATITPSDARFPSAVVKCRSKRLSSQACALRIAWWISLAAALLCLTILLIGYGAGYQRLYQPWPQGPSTHPFTALALTFLALGALSCRPFAKSRISVIFFALALSIGLTRLIDVQWSLGILHKAGLFSGVLSQAQANGSPIVFGWNTAVAVTAAALAGLSRAVARPLLTQAITVFGLTPPLVSFVGYAYGLHGFAGEMSLYTTLLLFGILVAMLLSTAHRSVVRMLLNTFIAGKMARRLMVAVILIPFIIGLLIVYAGGVENNRPIAILVVGFALGDALLIVWVLMEIERLDWARRKQERDAKFGATHDALTGLSNRRVFDAALSAEQARLRRHSSKCCVVMLDVDKFKQVNDKYGHQIGDQVLIELGNILHHTARASDVIARYGGEEFVALLPDTELAGAVRMAEKARQALNAAIFFDQNNKQFSVTMSAGVAEYRAEDDSIEALVNRADRALYAAKAGGRNRTYAASDRHTTIVAGVRNVA
jgi:diguanylate cyclase (GGDEF)-like protein